MKGKGGRVWIVLFSEVTVGVSWQCCCLLKVWKQGITLPLYHYVLVFNKC